MNAKQKGICPFCSKNVAAEIIEENTIRRDRCKCPECGETVFYAALRAATILPKAPKFTITSYARAAQARSLMPGPESPLLSEKWQAQ